jgi:hypothetical protein
MKKELNNNVKTTSKIRKVMIGYTKAGVNPAVCRLFEAVYGRKKEPAGMGLYHST